MKNWIFAVVLVFSGFCFGMENSILFPKQLQPKKSVQEQTLELLKEQMRLNERYAAESIQNQRRIRDEARERFGTQLLLDGLHDLKSH